jgi:hypothetical protein
MEACAFLHGQAAVRSESSFREANLIEAVPGPMGFTLGKSAPEEMPL